MQALSFELKTKSLKLIKKEVPKVEKEDDILIKVAFAGICGTDLHILEGQFPCRKDGEFSLGHEFSGTVVSVGTKVKNFKIGDRVAVDPNSGCNNCKFCRSSNPHYCKTGGLSNTIGIHRNGGWADYALIPVDQVHKIPDSISFQQAALCEPLSCIAHGWDRISPVTIGQRILITGAGIIGNLWASILHLQGHRKVTISEPNADRLKMLKNTLSDYDFVTPSILSKRHAEDEEYLFDLVIDCTGNSKAIEQGFSLLEQGGKFCIFGVASPDARISISPFDVYKNEITMIGVNINPFTFIKSIGLAESLGEKYLNYKDLGVRTFKLSEYKDALDVLHQGKISKAVFQL